MEWTPRPQLLASLSQSSPWFFGQTREPLFLLPQPPPSLGQTRAAAHWHTSLTRLSFDQPPTTTSLTLLSSLLLLTTTHCKEDDEIRREIEGQKTTFEKGKKTSGLVLVRPGRPGHGSTRWVDRVLPSCCTSRSFNKPEPVQVPGRPVRV